MNTIVKDKQYITGLDIFRFIASIFVILLHSFMEYENILDAYIIRIFVRWMVPFFFMISGYFLKDDTKAFIKYILHILTQYIFWTLFYAIVFRYDIWAVKNFLSALRSGLIMPFWYYPTLLLCSTFVWLLFKILKKPKWIVIICSILFVYAIIGHTLINVPFFDFVNNGRIMQLHHRIIGETTTRDGLFWASLYIALGKTININKDNELFRIKNYKKFWIILSLVFLFESLEECLVVYFNTGEKDILIGTIPFVIMLFTLALNIKIDKNVGTILRTCSNCNYLVHYFFLKIFMDKGILSAPLFFLTLICTLAVSVILTTLSQKFKPVQYIV